MNSREKEEWRPIKGYEGLYEVSNMGRVKSLPKYNRKTTILLKPTERKRDGRLSVMLVGKDKIKKRITVHRLVAIAFIKNDKPDEKKEINHKDENPKNNYVENLEWCDRKYNMNYGTTPYRLNEKNKKMVSAYTKEGDEIIFNSLHCAKRIGFDPSGINKAIKKGRKYKGYYWRQENG